jgi:hypothetical protein
LRQFQHEGAQQAQGLRKCSPKPIIISALDASCSPKAAMRRAETRSAAR